MKQMKMNMKRTTLYIALFLLAYCGKDALAQQSLYGLRLQGDALGNVLTLKAPAGMTTYTLTFPSTHGNLGQVPVTTDAAGTLGWLTPVTSVGLALPSIFTVTVSPITSSGTLTATLVNETANTIFAGPNGSTGTPTFRALVTADIPNSTVTYSKIQNETNATLLGNNSGSSAAPSEITLGPGLSFTGSQLNTVGAAPTGNAGGDLAGSTYPNPTIAAGAVTLAKMANLAANSIIGNNTASAGVPLALSTAQVKTMLNLAGSNSGDITLTPTGGETYLSLSGQTLTANPIDLSSVNATGTLAAGRFPALSGVQDLTS